MYVNGLTFLTTVSKHILYRTSFFIPTREIPDIMTGLDKVMTLYKQAGFKVTTIYGDKEFKPLEDIIFQKYHSTLNCSCAQEHVPKAKNNNKVIKERTRAAYYSLPFKAITKTMTKYLVMDATKKLIFFPTRWNFQVLQSPYDTTLQTSRL